MILITIFIFNCIYNVYFPFGWGCKTNIQIYNVFLIIPKNERIISTFYSRGAKLSKGGKAIIAMASRTNKGFSKIVPTLKPGAGVVTPRADVQWVVTEFGAVNLYGKSLQERAKLLISIAHTEDREALERATFERFGRVL